MTSIRKETTQCPGSSSVTPYQTSVSFMPLWRLEIQEETEAVSVYIPVSVGELVDKITIMSIRTVRGGEIMGHISYDVYNELRDLEACFSEIKRRLTDLDADKLLTLRDKLRIVNESLWELEDEIRKSEANKDFGESFIEISRSIYKTNDRRSELKAEINELTGSAIKEYKHYVKYEKED